MRYLISLLAVCGCAEAPATDPRVDALEAKVASLEAAVGALPQPADNSGVIRSLADRVTALEAAVKATPAPSKVPHLIVRETEQDLGPFVAWGLAWSEDAGAYYSTVGMTLRYLFPGCQGAPYIQGQPPSLSRYFAGDDGALYLSDAEAQPCTQQSQRVATGCMNGTATYSECSAALATGFAAVVAEPSQVYVTLR